MFLVDWFYNIGIWFGFFKKNAKIVIIGLGNAGKTTFLHFLVTGTIKAHFPTQRPNNDSFTYGNVNFNAYDLGGQKNLKFLWKQYVPDDKTIIIFMVDSTDYQSILESKTDIQGFLNDENLSNAPFLILGSKIDCAQHYNREQLIDLLGLRSYKLGLNVNTGRPLDLLMVSSVKRVGVKDILEWLDKCTDILNQ